MQTFLPNNYSFSINNLINPTSYFIKLTVPIIIVSIIMLVMTIIILLMMHISKSHKIWHGISLGIILLTGSIFIYGIYRNGFSQNPVDLPSLYTSQKFKIANKSNLYVKMNYDSQLHPKTQLDNNRYPYDIYLSHNFDLNKLEQKVNDSEEYHIGTVSNGKLKCNNTVIAPIFYKYYAYIKQHHLEQKFRECAYLEFDPRYMTKTMKSQVVLSNHKDTVLHFEDNTVVKQSRVTKN